MPLENAEINLLRKPEGLLIIEEFINDSEEKFMIDFMSDEFRDSGNFIMQYITLFILLKQNKLFFFLLT